eukprot:GHVL01038293.1.p1 GENE.GHVL01038293.1~~GHVL01038293.1.p1  ORF type:complete len:186 (+),score=21.99 GHVL01038293.1:206-763(+)
MPANEKTPEAISIKRQINSLTSTLARINKVYRKIKKDRDQLGVTNPSSSNTIKQHSIQRRQISNLRKQKVNELRRHLSEKNENKCQKNITLMEPEQMTIERQLLDLNVGTRTVICALINGGCVKVNGIAVKDPSFPCNVKTDKIMVMENLMMLERNKKKSVTKRTTHKTVDEFDGGWFSRQLKKP